VGATAHLPHQRGTWEGWEDSAVARGRLGDYLRDRAGRLAATAGILAGAGMAGTAVAAAAVRGRARR
jgi:hypothetical protein